MLAVSCINSKENPLMNESDENKPNRSKGKRKPKPPEARASVQSNTMLRFVTKSTKAAELNYQSAATAECAQHQPEMHDVECASIRKSEPPVVIDDTPCEKRTVAHDLTLSPPVHVIVEELKEEKEFIATDTLAVAKSPEFKQFGEAVPAEALSTPSVPSLASFLTGGYSCASPSLAEFLTGPPTPVHAPATPTQTTAAAPASITSTSTPHAARMAPIFSRPSPATAAASSVKQKKGARKEPEPVSSEAVGTASSNKRRKSSLLPPTIPSAVTAPAPDSAPLSSAVCVSPDGEHVRRPRGQKSAVGGQAESEEGVAAVRRSARTSRSVLRARDDAEDEDFEPEEEAEGGSRGSGNKRDKKGKKGGASAVSAKKPDIFMTKVSGGL
jgi:hypothetical protein